MQRLGRRGDRERQRLFVEMIGGRWTNLGYEIEISSAAMDIIADASLLPDSTLMEFGSCDQQIMPESVRRTYRR